MAYGNCRLLAIAAVASACLQQRIEAHQALSEDKSPVRRQQDSRQEPDLDGWGDHAGADASSLLDAQATVTTTTKPPKSPAEQIKVNEAHAMCDQLHQLDGVPAWSIDYVPFKCRLIGRSVSTANVQQSRNICEDLQEDPTGMKFLSSGASANLDDSDGCSNWPSMKQIIGLLVILVIKFIVLYALYKLVACLFCSSPPAHADGGANGDAASAGRNSQSSVKSAAGDSPLTAVQTEAYKADTVLPPDFKTAFSKLDKTQVEALAKILASS